MVLWEELIRKEKMIESINFKKIMDSIKKLGKFVFFFLLTSTIFGGCTVVLLGEEMAVFVIASSQLP